MRLQDHPDESDDFVSSSSSEDLGRGNHGEPIQKSLSWAFGGQPNKRRIVDPEAEQGQEIK